MIFSDYVIGSREMRTEDGYIVHECINGDKSAFALLVDKYKAAIFAIAYNKLLNFQDAEDVTQEVFIKAYQKLNTLKNYDRFIVWLHSITNNLCKDWLRSRHRRPDREFIEDQKPSVLDSPSLETYKDNVANELIQDALDSMPEIYRQILTLHYLGGMKDAEIAEFLGMSHTNVRQRLMKARTLLKEEVVSMMNTVFDSQKLQAGFTFRIVEIVKRIKIHPVSTMKGLPWGLSLATGLIITFLSLNPYIPQLSQIGTISGAPLLSESKVLKVGEIPVDVVKTSNIPILSSKMGKGKSGEPKQPDMQNAFFMAPKVEGGTWAKKADMPTARWLLSTAVVNGKIYAIGGGGGWDNTAKIEEYDPETDTWSDKFFQLKRDSFASTNAVDSIIYIIEGQGVDGDESTVQAYNPVTNEYIKKSDLPTVRRFICASAVNGKIYIIGGGNEDWPSTKVYSLVEEYDPVTDIWTKKSDMPTARWYFSTSVANGKIYAIGGIGQGNVRLSLVEEYDPATDTWTKKANMSTARCYFTTTTGNGRIYAIGGQTPDGKIVSTVEAYDPTTDTWMKKTDMGIQRGGLSASVVNGKIYAIGGETSSGRISSVEEYTSEDWKEAVSPQNKLPKTWGNIKSR